MLTTTKTVPQQTIKKKQRTFGGADHFFAVLNLAAVVKRHPAKRLAAISANKIYYYTFWAACQSLDTLAVRQ
jgi:hypothetical protein